jgi:hypothetical protein
MSPDDLLRLLWDPTAPLPASWPGGALGAFLLFLVPVGGGIPLGVLMARDGGVSPLVTALLYLASDVALALFTEPWLACLRWLSRRVTVLGRVGARLSRLSSGIGLRDSGSRGPLGLILVSFTISPTTGRAAAAAAGHGFLSGWALAITGDMAYFGLLMGSTLWLSKVFGDDRLTIGAVLLGSWVLPLLLRHLRRRSPPVLVPQPAMALARVAATPDVSPERPTRTVEPRRRAGRSQRRRPTRGLHYR